MEEQAKQSGTALQEVAAAIGPVLIIVGKVISAVGTIGYLDMETMNIVTTQMYIDGYQVKLVSDTSYGSLWEISFTLKEF